MPLKELVILTAGALLSQAQELPGTRPLNSRGDHAALMLDGIHAWLDQRLLSSPASLDVSDPAASRAELRSILGMTGNRTPFTSLDEHPPVGTAGSVRIYGARWPVLREARAALDAEGLYLQPGRRPACYVVLIPDADETPEQMAGLAPGLAPDRRHALQFAANGCAVLVPSLIDRGSQWSGNPNVRMTKQPHREFVYRMAYQLGRHIIGYELEKVLAAVDWFSRQPRAPIGVFGQGEGGLLALHAGALDERIQAVGVTGYSSPRETVWSEPLYRNVFGQLTRFGDAQLAKLIAPRALIAEPRRFLEVLGRKAKPLAPAPVKVAVSLDTTERRRIQFMQMVEFTQALVRDADRQRKQYWSAYKPADPATLEPYRERFADWIGRLPVERSTEPVQSRQAYDTASFSGYEVKLPVTGDVFAYGVLLLPKDMKPGERRPVVVAQHGLEGRPQFLVDPVDNASARDTYRAYAAKLAERGYVVYAPQNPYILGERFRQAQRKANPLGLTLFSFIVAQHARTLEWLKSLPMVDPDRIAFYGLSYGGFTAMRVPVLLPDYKVVICSGNFNEWTWKTTSIDAPYSYMFTGEYEIPEFAQGVRFGHFEMARMIAPRPFMVERGHRDGVGIDEWVAYEYAKVARHYRELGIPERTGIEYFDGVHRIDGVGTFRFLDRWLNWTPPSQK